MMHNKKHILLALLCFLTFQVVFGQTEPKRKVSNTNYAPVRGFLNKFTLNVSTGYGATFFSHDIEGVGLIQKSEDSIFIFDNTFIITGPISTGYNNWFNDPQANTQIPVNPGDVLVGTDSLTVTYKTKGHSVPIDASIFFNFDRYRFGIGGSYEVQTIGKFRPNVLTDQLTAFSNNFTTTTIGRYYIFLGGEVLRTLRHKIIVDAKVGQYLLSKKHYNLDVIKKGVFFNIGVSFERSLSEYFKVFVRPSYEFKNYTVNIPETGYSVNHNMPAFYVSVGVGLKLPDLKKCPIKNCAAQIDHQHNGNVYRSRVHKMWKWQDPDYGQNYKQLIKYKGKNKKKMNPY